MRLRFWSDAAIPFVEAIDWDQEASVFVRRTKGGLFGHRLSTSIKGLDPKRNIFGPGRDETPAVTIQESFALLCRDPSNSSGGADIPTWMALGINLGGQGSIEEGRHSRRRAVDSDPAAHQASKASIIKEIPA